MNELDILGQVDPQTLELMLQALSAPETMGMGGQMMGAERPQGREVGRTYVASSPLEHMAAALQRAMGGAMIGRGQEQRKKGLGAFIRSLGAGQPPMAPTAAPVAPEEL